jgi:hypothetical protein
MVWSLPAVRADAPRTAGGAIPTRALSAGDLAQFKGVLGHYHVTNRKYDPGPAFDWDRFLTRLRALGDEGR